MKYLIAAIFSLILFSGCKDEIMDDPQQNEASSLYRYFPLDSGSYIIYSVDSIIHDYADDNTDNPDSLIDTLHYQVMEVVDSSFTDGEGDKAWRIARYYRDNDSSGWNFTSLWTAKRTNNSAQKVEENIRFVKLSFPVKEDRSWNGNLFNFLPEEDYTIDDANVPLALGTFDFDSTVTVIQLNDSNAIHRIYKWEKYAYGIGLIYRQRDSLNVNYFNEITNGIQFRQTIIDYSPR